MAFKALEYLMTTLKHHMHEPMFHPEIFTGPDELVYIPLVIVSKIHIQGQNNV